MAGLAALAPLNALELVATSLGKCKGGGGKGRGRGWGHGMKRRRWNGGVRRMTKLLELIPTSQRQTLVLRATISSVGITVKGVAD